jgi:hypothetical protein
MNATYKTVPPLGARHLFATLSLLLCPLPAGALPKKSIFRLIYCRFNALNLSISLSDSTFWAKPPTGEGQGEGYRVCPYIEFPSPRPLPGAEGARRKPWHDRTER